MSPSDRGKLREVYTCGPVDLIVHRVVAEVIREAVAPALSPRVFSYRAVMPWAVPVTELPRGCGPLAGPDSRRRGVHVLRCDVASYTDSIPIGAVSPLWPMLTAHLGDPVHPLVGDVIRAAMVVPGGGVACRLTGLPMGPPIASVLAHLYLGPLDAALAAVPGGFYTPNVRGEVGRIGAVAVVTALTAVVLGALNASGPAPHARPPY